MTKTKWKDDDLWQGIADHEVDQPGTVYGFLDRLAFENGWTAEFAKGALLEYKRFIYLLCRADHPVTPSVEVDQVWHLHLLYTRNYWDEFAPKLSTLPHHGPTAGGTNEHSKFKDWYERTLNSYERIFEESPPQSYWPPCSLRFRTDQALKFIDVSGLVIIRRNKLFLLLFFLTTLLLISCAVDYWLAQEEGWFPFPD